MESKFKNPPLSQMKLLGCTSDTKQVQRSVPGKNHPYDHDLVLEISSTGDSVARLLHLVSQTHDGFFTCLLIFVLNNWNPWCEILFACSNHSWIFCFVFVCSFTKMAAVTFQFLHLQMACILFSQCLRFAILPLL